MSRIGKAPISLSGGVTVQSSRGNIVIKGPRGEVKRNIPQGISVATVGENLEVTRANSDRRTRALHGLVRAQLASDITGVTDGWTKTLELSGVGYRASIAGNDLTISVGFSHPVLIAPPPGITFSTQENKIVVSGIDKQLVGQVAAGDSQGSETRAAAEAVEAEPL